MAHLGDRFAVEVKSGHRKTAGGLAAFQDRYKKAKACFVTRENYAAFANAPLLFLSKNATR